MSNLQAYQRYKYQIFPLYRKVNLRWTILYCYRLLVMLLMRGIPLLESKLKYVMQNMTAKEACGSGRVNAADEACPSDCVQLGLASYQNRGVTKLLVFRLHTRWVAAAGGFLTHSVPLYATGVEVSPLCSYAGENLEPICRGRTFHAPCEITF